MQEQLRPVYRWLILGCVLIALMVIIGGITRLTESGLSITEWNVVKGTLPPLSEEAWVSEFEKYQQTTEFKEINAGMDLSGFKQIYFWEYFHRLWGRMMGIAFIIPFFYFWRKGLLKGWLMKRCLVILLGGALVGSLGWFMVMSGLKDRTDVSHYRLAIHLCAAFSLFIYVLWTALSIKFDRRKNTNSSFDRLKTVGVWLFVVVFVQIIYGAFTAGLNAGTIYNTWPLMNGEFMPDNVTALGGFLTNFTDHKDGVQFVHRWFAFIVVGLVFYAWWETRGMKMSPSQQSASWLIIAAVLLQFALG
ncbi:MAG TPA: COX15/CtaA family protein, partial [Luteibaculaceae bacterium]|nr:COX15/CtaA family protein [Luteibaculaceae bacterium]